MSKNILTTPFSTRFVAPIVMGLLANSLPVGREMSRKVLFRLFLTSMLRVLSLFLEKMIDIWLLGNIFFTELAHSITMIF